MTDPADIVRRLWAHDPSLWTSSGEEQWLGWLEAPDRELSRVDELLTELSRLPDHDTVVVLGMGGSSLAPEVFRRAFDAAHLHVLDTTHPTAVRRLAASIEPRRTLFVVSSKSGGTIETRSHFDFFYELSGRDGGRFVVVTDPGSPLEQLAEDRAVTAVFHGIPTIGGRYSALSPFGLVPLGLTGADVEGVLAAAVETADACRLLSDGANPGLALGLALAGSWQEGRDKVCIDAPWGLGLWLEQLLAESTGKQGKGLVPAPDEPSDGPDRQQRAVVLDGPVALGAEMVRWEVATAVAGHVLGINPFDQPDVQAAKDRTTEVLAGGLSDDAPATIALDELLAGAQPGDYVAIQGFVDPEHEPRLEILRARARETGCVVTVGLGPRYLHSTGQLHKGGPPSGIFVQVVDDPGDELPIPGRPFGFGRLIEAQAAGDLAALTERGRRVARVRLEEVA